MSTQRKCAVGALMLAAIFLLITFALAFWAIWTPHGIYRTHLEATAVETFIAAFVFASAGAFGMIE